jgi:cellulose synthase/poly-beta-1,6-N-acetylglucosamine synthase-like glycosyltransferase
MRSSPPARPGRRLLERLRVPLQIVATIVVGVVGPFFAYLLLDRAGFEVTPIMYLVVVAALAVTGGLIWVEGLLALDRPEPPDEPGAPEPPASAIIAAYLPNEAATVIETIEAFLRIDYDAPLQVILAYNTPEPMPIEARLAELAEREPRFNAFRVEGSTSKAQNVNAALAIATGEFVGVFDADHHPDPGNYRRAWRWLSNGYDVVQGHCLVRNGDASWVARLCAVEFEAIYTVSHPGRARLHGFGIFGGSNGYWRTDLLHEIRMRGSMLTEDIDSSLRVIEGGGRIASDPGLVSRELATTTLHQLWNQRMRWAQGWFQVSMQHLRRGMWSKDLSPRQKLGLLHLLGWREVYPWLSFQMFPLIAYWIYRGDRLDWFVPIFVLTTLFTLSVGPFQTYFAYRLSDPAIREHRRWYLTYLLITSVFYTEYKNVIARVAQVKELMGERAWKVTPRSNPPAPPTDD